MPPSRLVERGARAMPAVSSRLEGLLATTMPTPNALPNLASAPERVFISVDSSTGRSTLSYAPATAGTPITRDDDPKGEHALGVANASAHGERRAAATSTSRRSPTIASRSPTRAAPVVRASPSRASSTPPVPPVSRARRSPPSTTSPASTRASRRAIWSRARAASIRRRHARARRAWASRRSRRPATTSA